MSYLTLTKQNGVGLISVHRPEALNALNREIIDELDALLDQIRTDKSIRALVLWSEKNFAAGSDIKSMVELTVPEAAEFVFTPTYNKLDLLDIPTIAGIEGYALGGGLELAITCDIRFAAASAKVGYPEINLGIMPGAGGTIRTPLKIGSPWARELIYSGDIIDAQRALQIGLVNRVYDEAELFPETMKFAEKLAKKSAPGHEADQGNHAGRHVLRKSAGRRRDRKSKLVHAVRHRRPKGRHASLHRKKESRFIKESSKKGIRK